MPSADISNFEPLVHETAGILKALSHPERLKICCALRHEEMSVGDIETFLGIDQPRLSRELAKLRELELVNTRRESKLIYYTLNCESKVGALLDAICAVMQNEHSS